MSGTAATFATTAAGTRRCRLSTAHFAREAVSLFVAKSEREHAIPHDERIDCVLSHDAAVIFDFDVEVVGRHHGTGKFENFRQLPCGQPVLAVILRDPSLEETGLERTNRAPAINEPTGDVSHLCDVELSWNGIAIREHKTDLFVGMLKKTCVERS